MADIFISRVQKKSNVSFLKIKLSDLYRKIHPVFLLSICIIGIIVQIQCFFLKKFNISLEKPPIIIGIAIVGISFLFLIIGNILLQDSGEKDQNPDYTQLSHLLKASQWVAFFTGVSIIIKYLGYGKPEYIWAIIIIGLNILILLEIVIHSVKRLLSGRIEENSHIPLYILTALMQGGNPINNLFFMLQQNTGISLRSSYALSLLRRDFMKIG